MPKKILIIEDEENLLRILKKRLEAEGYEVSTAENGLLGLKEVKKNRPDLILLDIIMPVMDGFDFYNILKKDTDISDIPVIAVSGRPKLKETFDEMGVDEFISKPFNYEEFAEKIKDLIDN